MAKIQIKIKDPDLLPYPSNASEAVQDAHHKKVDEYAEHGDYWRIELDTKTFKGRLLPKREWK